MSTHFNYTKDCFWSFTNLIETGDDPVFLFSELMRRNNKEDDTSIRKQIFQYNGLNILYLFLKEA